MTRAGTYVIATINHDLKPSVVLRTIGGTYILSLSPPISAILFVATSGNAVNAWLGSLRLNGQILALEGLGVRPERYFWSPAWLALVAAYIVTFVAFYGAMAVGGWILFDQHHVAGAWTMLTADLLDCPPEREAYRVRAAWLVGTFALAIASIVVARGASPKRSGADVTAAMTSSVMRATLLVVALELVSLGLVERSSAR